MTQKVRMQTITIPIGLNDEAHRYGLNISKVCTNALQRAIEALKKDDMEQGKA